MIALCFFAASVKAQDRCSEVMSYQQRLYGADYIPYIQARLGGHASRWSELFSRIHAGNRSLEELRLIDEIFLNTQARSWLARQVNSFKFVRLEQIARTLDRVYMNQIDLSKMRSWDELSLHERRALLLLSFKKWWWEVDSNHVIGFSRWTDASYLLSRSLSEPLAQGRLDARLHELLATPNQSRFLGSLIKNFRNEIKILESLKGQPNAQQVLIETLGYRVEFLKKARTTYGLQGQRLRLMEMQILRSGVLLQMLEQGRALRSQEIRDIAIQNGLDPKLAAEMHWGQIGMSLIPNMNSFVNITIDIALTSAMAYVIGHYWFDDFANEGVYQGSFNDFFNVEPMPVD